MLSDLNKIKEDLVLLKDLKAQVSQIRESIHKTETAPKLYPPVDKELGYGPANHPAYAQPQFHQPRGPVQEYHAAGGPRFMTGTAQFQQRFAQQRYPMPRSRPRCFGCQQQREEYCTHCYKCGGSEHFHAGCRGYRGISSAVRERPLNEERLPPRDRE